MCAAKLVGSYRILKMQTQLRFLVGGAGALYAPVSAGGRWLLVFRGGKAFSF